MPVQTCTKEKPASVVTHRTGRVELWDRSIHSIHRLCAGVKRFLLRICSLLSLPNLSTDLLASLCFPGSRVCLRVHATRCAAPRAVGEGEHLALSNKPSPRPVFLPSSSRPL
jgi:hypothetical protein